MEDQQPDSGDLTAQDPLVPEGKSARSRHRLPRGKQRQAATESADEVEAPSDEADEVYDAEPSDEPAEESVAEEPVTEAEVAPEADAPAQPKRRWWQRNAPAAETPETVVEPAADESEDEPAQPETTAAADEPEAEAAQAEADEPEAETDEAETDEPEPEPILVPHRTAPQGLKIATAVAAALVVIAAAFAGAMVQPYLSERASVQVKQDVAERAAAAITTLWTYTPEDIDQLANRTAPYLGGDFASQYKTFIDSIAEANKAAQVTNQTQVVGAAVESLTPTEATAIVYTNSVSSTPTSKGFQSMRYLSYRLTLEHRDRKWLITKMNDVTSLDLSPQI